MTNGLEAPPFVTHLKALKEREDRGALAALRRGLGQPPGYAPEVLPYVVPYIPAKASRWQETTYYLIASLFGYHPEWVESGNFGDHFARLRQAGGDDTAVERRFTALLAAHPDDLGTHLRQAVSLLKSKDIPVNWGQLFRDVQSWNHPEYRASVHRAWARGFWGSRQSDSQPR